MATIFLVELTGFTDAGVSKVYGWCTGSGRDDLAQGRGYCPLPTDAAPVALYETRVLDPGTISRRLFAAGSAGARAQPNAEVDAGFIRLANIDGALDSLFDGSAGVSFREREVRVLSIEEGAAYSTARLLLRASVSQAQLTQEEVEVGLKSRIYELASQHQTVLYAGSNTLPAGVEGVDDLKGKPKPQVWGKVFGIEPKQVNTAKKIYHASQRGLVSVDAVYDGGVALPSDGTYANQTDLENDALAPAAGKYKAWLAGGMIRLGSSPAYRLTMDCSGDSGANSTCAQLLKAMALARGWASGDISASDVTALDALEAGVLGEYIDDTRTTLEAMSNVARGIASFWPDRLGVLRMRRFDLPAADGSSPVVLASWNCRRVRQVPAGEDVPTTTIRVRYARYRDVQRRNEVAPGLAEALKVDLAEEWRVATATTTPAPNPHKRLQIAEVDTAYTAKANAETAATRLLGLTSGPRRTHLLEEVYLSPEEIEKVELGGLVELRWNRYGFSPEVGTLRRVIAITELLRSRQLAITVWGA